ncbi:MAG: flagellar export protein FliJ [Lachnospiraceae bacterium]|nr:flagellar export protein FliJ [Lachnospiraceae bacterium]
MAKFIYRMQNILDIKYKLEEQAKQEYMAIQVRLNEEQAKLAALEDRKEAYFDQYRVLLRAHLDVLEIETCKNAIILMDEYIRNQQLVVAQVEKELDQAIRKMNEAMQERKIHEKLREKQFEAFLQELNQEEMKEIDQLISYQYNHGEEQEE